MNNLLVEVRAVALLVVVLAGVVALCGGPGVVFAPPAPPAPVVVLAVDGLAWPQLAPLVARGALAGLTGRGSVQHAAVRPSGDVAAAAIWRELDLAAHVERCGRPVARFAWPGTADRATPELVVLPPGTAPLEPAVAKRLGRDLGTSAAAVARLGAAPAPALVLAHFEGPVDLDAALPPGPLPPLAPGYAELLAGALDRVARAAPPGSTVVVIGRGTARAGLPDGQGAWLAAGPRLRAGALPDALRITELAATLLELACLPLPAAVTEGAAVRALITPPVPVNRRITWLSTDRTR